MLLNILKIDQLFTNNFIIIYTYNNNIKLKAQNLKY